MFENFECEIGRYDAGVHRMYPGAGEIGVRAHLVISGGCD
jgi:hypothetical protein